MPADRGRNGPHWNPTPDFKQTEEEAVAQSRGDYVPRDATAFARFLCRYVVIPEMMPYEHSKSGLESVSQDVAERGYYKGTEANLLVEFYLLTHDELGRLIMPFITDEAIDKIGLQPYTEP